MICSLIQQREMNRRKNHHHDEHCGKNEDGELLDFR